MQTTVLTAADLRCIVQDVGLDELMDRMIDGLYEALSSFDVSRISTPPRYGCEYKLPYNGLIELMPAVQYGEPVGCLGGTPRL